MSDPIQMILDRFTEKFRDKRLHVFDVRIDTLSGDNLFLSGRVLEDSQIRELSANLTCQYSNLKINLDGVQILRNAEPKWLTVATNLTSLHATPSFLTEMLTQMVFGMRVELLIEQGIWCFVRQEDGYLGWSYRPYLTEQNVSSPTHMVIEPVCLIRAEPHPEGRLLSRLMGGTAVAGADRRNGWIQVNAWEAGWVLETDLRSLEDIPQTKPECRSWISLDAARMLSVPYLWGGSTGHGIDCSGFAQLLHRWVGITIPRDADMQFAAGTPVEQPLQPGDLLFFAEGSNRKVTHVGISLGDWKMIHSSRSRNGVGFDDLETTGRLKSIYVGARTFI